MRRLSVILPVLAAAPLAAQDTATTTIDQPIRIGVDYAVNRPGLVVLPGAGLDSARAIVRRDLDHTDRFEMLGDFASSDGSTDPSIDAYREFTPSVFRAGSALPADHSP